MLPLLLTRPNPQPMIAFQQLMQDFVTMLMIGYSSTTVSGTRREMGRRFIER
jgi:hypothetical protein